ncbi:rod-binding protein [Roseovarius aquimarinus]|uniref:Rod-binding protein n=1 Tax=Roseovarius aquimarinus TaxID=1229156 RepID=A0ABW7IAV0_9RHOB
MTAISPPGASTAPAQPQPIEQARAAARKLEATFLAEMLKSAGLGRTAEFGGGIGENQFASFHTQALAEKLAEAGGIGLADAFFRSMMEARHDD